MMTAMGISQRPVFVVSLIVIGMLAAACSGSGRAATATPDPTEATPAPTEDAATAEATSELPEWVQTRLESGDTDGDGTQDLLERYVAATGGGGVAHRTACEDGARLSTVWPEGTKLEVVASSSTECGDWTLVTDGEITSWVSDKYLAEEKPLPASGGGGGGGGASGWVQVLQYGQGLWQIPLSELRVAPAADTWCDFDSWHDPEGGDFIVSLVDGTPFVNPDPVRCGFGAVNSATILWVPAE